MEEETTLLHLWQANKVHVRLSTLGGSVELLNVWTVINQDTTSEQEIENLLSLFNQLAGTDYTLVAIAKHKQIDHVRRGNMLEISERSLWVLDLGDEVYPLYTVSEELAEFLAQSMQRVRKKERRSLTCYPHGRDEYAGSLLVICCTIERITGNETE